MATQAQRSETFLESPLPQEVLYHLYESMLKVRLLESSTRGTASVGEAILAGTLENADASDLLVAARMNPVLEVLRGAALSSVARVKGTPTNVHETPTQTKIFSPGEANTLGFALGMAMALKQASSSSIVILIVPGKLAKGAAWHEAANFAGAQRLPIVFVTASTDSRSSRSHQSRDCSHWPCPRIAVDESDVIAVYRVTKEATSAARRGYGPTLVDCVSSGARGSRGKNQQDPLESFRGYLMRHNVWSGEWAVGLESRLKQQIRHG
jgi:Dehydrogenase E1 component